MHEPGRATPAGPDRRPRAMSPDPGRYQLTPPDLARWRAGNTGTEGVWRFDSHRPGRHVLITALVHGNELCGAWALAGLLEAGLRPRAGVLTLAFCNLAAFDRFDPAQPQAARFVDEDLNRVWQADKLADPGTAERRRALALRPHALAADWLLDLHSMSEPGPPLVLTGLAARHLALAAALGAPGHAVIDAGHPEGVRLRDLGRFGAPDAEAPEACALLVECGWHGAESSRAVAQDACLRFLVAAGSLPADEAEAALPGWRGPDATGRWALEVSGPVVARSERFAFTRPLAALECVPLAGTVVANNDGEPVRTPYDDCVMVMPFAGRARPGATVLRFARRRPL